MPQTAVLTAPNAGVKMTCAGPSREKPTEPGLELMRGRSWFKLRPAGKNEGVGGPASQASVRRAVGLQLCATDTSPHDSLDPARRRAWGCRKAGCARAHDFLSSAWHRTFSMGSVVQHCAPRTSSAMAAQKGQQQHHQGCCTAQATHHRADEAFLFLRQRLCLLPWLCGSKQMR